MASMPFRARRKRYYTSYKDALASVKRDYGRAQTRYKKTLKRSIRRVSTKPPVYANRRTGGFLGQELKFYDQNLNTRAISTSLSLVGGVADPNGSIEALNAVPQGDGESQRDGRRITMKSIYIRGQIHRLPQENQGLNFDAVSVFVALVLDTQTNGAQLSSEDVFVNVVATQQTVASPLTNLQFTSRFTVLKSQQFDLSIDTVGGNPGGADKFYPGKVKTFNWFCPLNDMAVTYKGTTEAVANIVDNSLHVIAFKTSNDGNTQLNYNSRLRFMG